QVGAQETEEPPALQVLHLHALVEADRVPARPQPEPELDVLDARLAVALVEPAGLEEHRAADRATTGPERRSLLAARLVHPVVEQVLVLRDELRARGRVVVVADNRGEARVAQLLYRPALGVRVLPLNHVVAALLA